MSIAVRPRLVTLLPIANIAFPTVLIVFILLAGGLIFGGMILALVYLFRKLSNRSEDHPDR